MCFVHFNVANEHETCTCYRWYSEVSFDCIDKKKRVCWRKIQEFVIVIKRKLFINYANIKLEIIHYIQQYALTISEIFFIRYPTISRRSLNSERSRSNYIIKDMTNSRATYFVRAAFVAFRMTRVPLTSSLEFQSYDDNIREIMRTKNATDETGGEYSLLSLSQSRQLPSATQVLSR